MIAGTADTTSYGVGIDHTIGALSFGIGYSSNTVSDNAYDGMKTVNHFVGDMQAVTDAGGGSVLPTTGKHPRPAAGDIDMSSLDFPGDIMDTKHTVISAGMTYDLGGGVEISAGIHSGKSKNVAGAGGAPDYVCSEAGSDERTVIGDKCWTMVPEGGPSSVYVTNDGSDGALQLRNVSDDSVVQSAAPSNPVSHSVSYAVTDIDDVGVGLRIAFSF